MTIFNIVWHVALDLGEMVRGHLCSTTKLHFKNQQDVPEVSILHLDTLQIQIKFLFISLALVRGLSPN